MEKTNNNDNNKWWINMKKVKFYSKIYLLILKQDIKTKLSYNKDFVISIVGILLTNIAGFVEFWVIFNNFPSIKGWSYYELIFMYAFSLLAITPSQCFFENNWNLINNVYSGDFIKYCLKPVNIFFYYISETFEIKGIAQFFMGIVLLVFSWMKLGIEFNILILIVFFINWITASIFMISIMTLASSTGFYFLNSDILMTLVFKFKDYARYPIPIYGSVLKFIFTFILPIGFLAYYPSLPLLRKNEISFVSYMAPFCALILLYFTYRIWMKGALSYDGTGN